MVSNGSGDGRPPEDRESDEPIAEIRELSVEPSTDFSARLRRRIDRKETTNHALWFSWYLPGAVLLAFLDMLFSLLGSSRGDGGGVS